MERVSRVIVVKGHQIDTLKVRKLCLIQDITPLLQGAEGKAEGGGNTVGGVGAEQGGACTEALLQSGDGSCIVGVSFGKKELTGHKQWKQARRKAIEKDHVQM